MRRIVSFLTVKRPAPMAAHPARRPVPHIHRCFSRRDLMKAAAGLGAASTIGALFGGWRLPGALAAAPGRGVPKPIPGGLEVGGTLFHIKLPGFAQPPDDDPATITDFNGVAAYAVISGMGNRTQLSTGETASLPFDVDMRFMKGVFVGIDGRVHTGAFGYL